MEFKPPGQVRPRAFQMRLREEISPTNILHVDIVVYCPDALATFTLRMRNLDNPPTEGRKIGSVKSTLRFEVLLDALSGELGAVFSNESGEAGFRLESIEPNGQA